jgi:hypothetical protein
MMMPLEQENDQHPATGLLLEGNVALVLPTERNITKKYGVNRAPIFV